MSSKTAKEMLKGAKLVDYTGTQNGFVQMKKFDQQFVDLLRKNSDGCKTVVVLDRGVASKSATPLEVHDHINLSGNNPLLGPNDPIGERFPIVQGIYLENCISGLSKCVVAGLKDGTTPSAAEQKVLEDVGANVCSYNMVQSMLVAAHAGWKVLGIILPEGAALSADQMKELNDLTGKN